MVVRMKLKIEQEEYSGLLKLALSVMRNPEDQLRYMLRQQLIQFGLPLRNETTMRDTSISAQTSRKDVKV